MQETTAAATSVPPSPKQRFLDAFEREHATTMRVLRAYPTDRLDLQPHPKCKNARELAWVFVVECGMGMAVFEDRLAELTASGDIPSAPESWEEILSTVEKAHRDFAALIAGASEEKLHQPVHFFTAPKTVGEVERLEFVWSMLHDQIHHRGQFSVYLRMADGRVPSIYGPTADEPWM